MPSPCQKEGERGSRSHADPRGGIQYTMAKRALEVDQPLDPDAIEGIPLPRETPWLSGQTAAEDTIRAAIAGGRFHHAWLLTGPKGIGKATLAFRVARFLLSHGETFPIPGTGLDVDLTSTTARKIAAGAHPNILHLQRPWDDKAKRFKTELSVDAIRRTTEFFGQTAAVPGFRIAIVDAADDMNASSANALLKILEEPPKRSLFFVLAHEPGRLLPTIRSRCRRLPLAPLSEATLRAEMERLIVDAAPVDRVEAAGLAGGSLRRALILARGGGLEIARETRALIKALPSVDPVAIQKLADRVALKGAGDAFEVFGETVRQALHARATTTAHRATAAATLEAWDTVNETLAMSDIYNLDRKSAVLAVFRALTEAAR